MRVAIVGGGISGLSTFLQLQKQLAEHNLPKETLDLTIFESHDLPRLTERADNIPSSGGGYGLAANGMANLRRLDPSLHEKVLRNGFPTAKFVMKSARGWTLGVMPSTDLRRDHPECCVMVLREVVISALYERVPPSVIVRHKVVKVEDGDEQAVVELDNGDLCSYDLVIGADGIWSKARSAVLRDKYPPEYRGLFTVAGWISTEHLPTPAASGPAAHGQTIMNLGSNGFMAYTPYTTGNTPATQQHITGNATLPPGKGVGAFWWSRSAQSKPTADPDDAALKQELIERHSSWKDPTILKIIQSSDIALKIPTFVMPKAPTWAGKRVVLVGDSAHALPSSSGQGVSQCLEDAEAFATLLAFNLGKPREEKSTLNTLQTTFKQYLEVRKQQVERVLDDGNLAGDSSREMGFLLEHLMYAMMWVMLKFFGAYFMKTVLDYDLLAEIEKVKRTP